MPFGVSPNGNDFLPSGATTSATTKFQVPTIWSRRLLCCAAAGDATSIKAIRPPSPMIFMSSPEVLRGHAPRQEYFGSRSSSSIEMPCGPRRKQIFMPGRGECGSLVNSTPFFLRSAAIVSKAETVETLIRRDRRRIDAVTGVDLSREDHGAAEPDVHARLSLLRRADDFRAEHTLEPLGRGLRIRRA